MENISRKIEFYAVKVGRKPGIYTDAKECLDQVIDFTGAEFSKFNSEKNAEEYLNFKETIQEEPDKNSKVKSVERIQADSARSSEIQKTEKKESSIHSEEKPDCEEDIELISFSSAISKPKIVYDDFIRPENVKDGFYAVRIGKKPGIYVNATLCQNQIEDIDDAEFDLFNTIEEARNFVKFGKTKDVLNFTHDDDDKESFYAVKAGYQPGIYRNFHTFQKQLKGFSNSISGTFETKEDAEKFMQGEKNLEGLHTSSSNLYNSTLNSNSQNSQNSSSFGESFSKISKPVLTRFETKCLSPPLRNVVPSLKPSLSPLPTFSPSTRVYGSERKAIGQDQELAKESTLSTRMRMYANRRKAIGQDQELAKESTRLGKRVRFHGSDWNEFEQTREKNKNNSGTDGEINLFKSTMSKQ